MPELPEIETVKLQLQKVLVGQTITSIEQLHKKSLQGNPKLVIGKKVESIERMGKMLVIHLSSDKLRDSSTSLRSARNESVMVIAIHFKMSGQLIFQPKADRPLDEVQSVKRKAKSDKNDLENRIVGGHPTNDWMGKLPSKHTRVIFHFKSGDTLYFNDQRIFGWVKILTQKELEDLPFVKKLGREIWDISDTEFFKLLQGKKRPIKVVLMDQEMLSGVGNIYANDALWETKIHPSKKAQDISRQDSKKLRNGLIKVLEEGIKYGGATAADNKYMNLHGMGGTYQNHFRTYHRTNLPCLRCKTLIKKIVLGGRGTYFCEKCQK